MKVWPVLKSLPQMGAAFCLESSIMRRNIDGEIGRAVGEGHALAERGVGVDLRRRDAEVVVLEALFEGFDGLVNGRGLEEDFGRAAPDHDHAIDGLLEGLDVGAHLVGEIALVLALLHVRAVEALDVVLIEDRGQRLDGFEIRLELLERLLVEHLGVRGGLVDVVFEDVPAGEDDVVQIGERNKILDQRRLVVGALAQADGAHLRERADGLGKPAANGFNAGNHRGGDGAQADDHYSQLALCGRDFMQQRSCGRLALSCAHRFSYPSFDCCRIPVNPEFELMQDETVYASRAASISAMPALEPVCGTRLMCDQTNQTIAATSTISTAR